MEDALAHGVVDRLQQVRHVVAEAFEFVAARALQLANLARDLVALVHPVALVRPARQANTLTVGRALVTTHPRAQTTNLYSNYQFFNKQQPSVPESGEVLLAHSDGRLVLTDHHLARAQPRLVQVFLALLRADRLLALLATRLEILLKTKTGSKATLNHAANKAKYQLRLIYISLQQPQWITITK